MFDFVEPRVRRVVADQLGVGADELAPDVSLVDDLAADSLDLVELALALENELGVVVPESVIEHLRTYGDLVDSLRVLSGPVESKKQTSQRPMFPVSARIVSGRHGGEMCRADVLTPYAMQSLMEDALSAGRGARLEVTVPSDLSDTRLALLEEDLGWLGERGVQVSVCRDQATRTGPRLEAARHRPYAPRPWLGSRSSYTGRF
jgi:acyl carrier protein